MLQVSSGRPAPVALMMTGAFSRNVGKLFSELKLVTDNFLSIYVAANWEATERPHKNTRPVLHKTWEPGQ